MGHDAKSEGSPPTPAQPLKQKWPSHGLVSGEVAELSRKEAGCFTPFDFRNELSKDKKLAVSKLESEESRETTAWSPWTLFSFCPIETT